MENWQEQDLDGEPNNQEEEDADAEEEDDDLFNVCFTRHGSYTHHQEKGFDFVPEDMDTPHVSNTSDQQLKCLNILRVAPWHSGCFSFCSSSKVLLVHLEFIDPAGQTF